MTYVFDTNSFRVMGNYFPARFPSFWATFNDFVDDGNVISVREVLRELDYQARQQHLQDWINNNGQIFLLPTPIETEFVSDIFAIEHFQALVSIKQRLKSTPVADPFIIASARIHGYCVVTEESLKPNAAKIPNVCAHFGIDCCNIETLMERESWEF